MSFQKICDLFSKNGSVDELIHRVHNAAEQCCSDVVMGMRSNTPFQSRPQQSNPSRNKACSSSDHFFGGAPRACPASRLFFLPVIDAKPGYD
jgi:hypothetical protein